MGQPCSLTSETPPDHPLGRRLSKPVGSPTTRVLYDGDPLMAETDATGTLLAKYLYGPGLDEPLRLDRGGQSYSYHADGLGSQESLEPKL